MKFKDSVLAIGKSQADIRNKSNMQTLCLFDLNLSLKKYIALDLQLKDRCMLCCVCILFEKKLAFYTEDLKFIRSIDLGANPTDPFYFGQGPFSLRKYEFRHGMIYWTDRKSLNIIKEETDEVIKTIEGRDFAFDSKNNVVVLGGKGFDDQNLSYFNSEGKIILNNFYSNKK